MQQSIQNQLNLLKKNQKSSPLLPYKAQSSLLFDFKYANVIDIDTIYEIAYEGLIQLSKQSDKFIQYFKSLLSSTSKYYNREMLSQKENEINDKQLRCLLRDLSSFFLNKHTHQVIEYLIKVYKVNLYLVDDYIFSFLCFYDTQIFIKLIQNVNFKENTQWNFISDFAKNAIVIPKESILKFCNSDGDFMTKLIYYYIDNFDIANEKYYYFIIDILKFKFDSMQKVKEKDKTILTIVIKFISFINKNLKAVSEEKYSNYIYEYYLLMKVFLGKININNDFLKAIANDICCKVFSITNKKNAISYLIMLISIICEKYYEINKGEIFKEESIISLGNKSINIIEVIKEVDLTKENSLQFLGCELLLSCNIKSTLFKHVMSILEEIFNSVYLVEKILILLYELGKKFTQWNLIEDLNQKNLNIAFISLYKNKKISHLPFKSNLDVYFNLISPNVPQVINAINECDLNPSNVNEHIISALSSRFYLFDEEIILSAILNMKHLDKTLIGKDILEFYFSFLKGKNKIYSSEFISSIKGFLKENFAQNEKFLLYNNVFFAKSKKQKISFSYNKVLFIQSLSEIFDNDITYNKLFNVSNTLEFLKLYFESKRESEEEYKLIEILIFNEGYQKCFLLHSETIKMYIIYLSNENKAELKYKHINALTRGIFTNKMIFADYLTFILNVHFKNTKQLYLAYILFEIANTDNIKKIIDYIIKFLQSEKELLLECILLFSLLNYLSYMTKDQFTYIFNTSNKINFSALSMLFPLNSNEDIEMRNDEQENKTQKIIHELIRVINEDKAELKINNKYIKRIFESTEINLEGIYLIANQLILTKKINPLYKEIIIKILSFFNIKNTFTNAKSKKKLLSYLDVQISNENDSTISNILLENFLHFYPDSEQQIIITLTNAKVSENIIAILFKNGFSIKSLNSLNELFTVIKFCIKNNVSPFTLNISFTEKELIDYLAYILQSKGKIDNSSIVYFYQMVMVNPSYDNYTIIKQSLDILNKSKDFDINLCYAIFTLTKSIKTITTTQIEEIAIELREILNKIISSLSIENVFKFEEEKKIELILSSSSNICANGLIHNSVLLDSYKLLSNESNINKLELTIKKEIITLLFNQMFDFMVLISKKASNDINDEFYIKYIEIIICDKTIEYNEQIFFKICHSEELKDKIKVLAFFYYRIYKKFKGNRHEVLNLYILDNSSDQTITKWMEIIEEIVLLKSKKEKVAYDLIGNIFSYLIKQKYPKNNDDILFEKILNIITLIFTKAKELTEKVILFSKKQGYLSMLLISLYKDNCMQKYSSSKNFILNKITPIIKSNEGQLFDFILQNIIIQSKEKKIENLVYIYRLLTKLTNANSNTKLIKQSIPLILKELKTSNKDLSYTFYFFSVAKYLIYTFDIFTEKFLIFFNQFIPKLISGLKSVKHNEIKTELKELIFDDLNLLTENSCGYLSPFLNQLIEVILLFDNHQDEAKGVLTKIAQKNIFDSSFSSAKANQSNMGTLLLHFINSCIQSADKLVIADMYIDIAKFFTQILLSNQKFSKEIIETFKVFILKINEKQLKKMFEMMLTILTERNDNREYKLPNCVIIFQFFNAILSVIKDIFVGDYFLKYKNIEIELISIANSLMFAIHQNENKKLKEKRKRSFDIDEVNEDFTYYKLSCLLIENIKLNFKYSKGELLTEIIEELFEPVLNQFKLNENKEFMLKYFEQYVKECLFEMFNNVKTDDLFKGLNDDMLNLIREENYITRLLTLKMIVYLLENIKERYMTLLADIVPYTAEMLEDSNELVQKQAVNTIQYIEKITGESYNKYID